nr:hypothetical protein [Tanacetum cinerariifolium]
MRIDPSKTQKEPTYQVVLDAYALTTCYLAFLITANVPEDDSILGTMRFVSKSKDFQVYGALLPSRMTNQQMWKSTAYKTYLAYGTSEASPKMKRKVKKPSSHSNKRALVTIDEEEPKPAKKVIPSKKPTAKRHKGIELLSDSALLEEAQLKKALKRNKSETTIHQAGGSSKGANSISEVPDEQKDKSIDTSEGTGLKLQVHVSKGDSSKSELTYVEPDDKDKGDKERTNAKTIEAENENVNQEGVGNQVKDDAQATQKTKVPIPSSSISSDYAAKFLNFDNIPLVNIEVVSMFDINFQHGAPHTLPILTIPISVNTKHTVINPSEIVTTTSETTISSLLTSVFPYLQQSTPTTTEATTSTTFVPDSETLTALHQRITDLEKDVKELKDVDNSTQVILAIQSEVPKAIKEYLGSSLDDAMHKETLFEAGDTQGPQNLREDTGNTDEPPVFNVDPKDWFKKPERRLTLDFEWNKGPAYNILKANCRSYVELDYNMEECYKQLYKFMKGEFSRLNLHEIKDMLILLVQNRLFNLKGDVIVHLAAALHMFTRRIVIQKRVEDL